MTLIKQSAMASMSAVALTGARFAFAAILARRLPDSTFGQFVFCQWLIEIAILVSSLGTSSVASRYLAEFRLDVAKSGAFLNRWRLVMRVLPFGAGLGAMVGLGLAEITLTREAQGLLFLWAVIASFVVAQSAALTGLQRFDVILKGNLYSAACLLAGALWITQVPSASVSWLFGVMAVANLAALLVGHKTLKSFKGTPENSLKADDWKSIGKYAFNMWLVAILWSLVWSRGELPIVRFYHGDSGVAGYAIALTLMGGAMQGVMLGVSAVAPEITRLLGNGRRAQADALARSVFELQLLLCGALAALLITLAPELIQTIFGATYLNQIPALGVLALGVISMALSTQNHILQIETYGSFSTRSTLLGLILLGILSVALVPSLETLGAAIARSTAMTLTGLLAAVQLWRIGRSESLSFGSLAGVYAIALLDLLITLYLQTGESSFNLRLLVLFTSLVCLAFIVRDASGSPKVNELGRRLLATVSR